MNAIIIVPAFPGVFLLLLKIVHVLKYVFICFVFTNLRFLEKLRYDFMFWCYIKQIMNIFIRAMVKIFS